MTPPSPPESLSEAGGRLWAAVLADYELSPAELALLELAGHAADDAAKARTVLAVEPLTIPGRLGPVAHPAVAIARRAEASIGRLLAQLGVIDRDAASGRHASTPGPKPTRRRR